jgi:hypothetical protein
VNKVVWSFSSLKTFEQCPRKYFHTKILRDVSEPDSQATIYGRDVHSAAEHYIRDDKPLPPKYGYIQPILDQLNSLEGEKHCELKLGLTRELEPCDFSAKNVWWHGIADLVVVNEAKKLAYSVDFKTSKSARYADVKQLDLVAVGLFKKFPALERIRSALIFVVSNDLVKAEHKVEEVQKYMEKPTQAVARIEAAIGNEVWNPVQGPLCRFCPVRTCEFNRS